MNEEAGPSNSETNEFRRQFYRELYFQALGNQAQYGRWILASLLAVHAGSLLAITQSGDAAQRLFAEAGSYLLWGLALALVCGGLAWMNFTAAMVHYGDCLRAAMENERKDATGPLLWIANFTLWTAPIGAVGSLLCFVFAALAANRAL